MTLKSYLRIKMGLIESHYRWDKTFRLIAVLSVIIAFLFLPNIRQVYAMPGGSEDSFALEQCISFNAQPTDIPNEMDRLCGKLVFLKDLKVEKFYLGLEVCGSGQILIFKTRPRELQNYYQLREAEIQRGTEISTDSGVYNQYIVTFKNYIPLNSCSECGRILTPTPRQLVPTSPGTQSLVFPTPSPRQPTITSTGTSTNTSTASPTATALSLTLSPPVQSTEVLISATAATATQALIAYTTPPTPTFQKTPPPGDNPSDLPDNSRFIIIAVAVAFIVSLGVGVFIMQRRQS